jgi:hypothetical protein
MSAGLSSSGLILRAAHDPGRIAPANTRILAEIAGFEQGALLGAQRLR